MREAILTLEDDGNWTLKTLLSVRGNNPSNTRTTIAEGTVALNTGWDARNEGGLKLKSTRPIQIMLVVNDTDRMVEIDDAGLKAIRDNFRWYEEGLSSGEQYIRGGNGRTASGNAVFLGFENCHER